MVRKISKEEGPLAMLPIIDPHYRKGERVIARFARNVATNIRSIAEQNPVIQ